MILESTVGYSGHYKIAVHRADGTIRNTYEFKNLITNTGMDMIRTGELDGVYSWCFLVGSGNSVPQFTDNSMQSFVAGWANSSIPSSSINQAGGYGSRIFTAQSTQGQAAGNLSEVGMSNKTDNTGKLFSRALILDGNGQPTTITVLSIEFLTISYELRCYWPTTDTTDTVTDSGITYTVLGRASNTTSTNDWAANLGVLYPTSSNTINGYDGNGDIGPITGMPTGTGFATIGYSIGAYTAGSFYNDDSVIIPVNSFNGPNGLKCVSWGSGCGRFQNKFTPVIAKDNTKTLELHRRISWTRV